MSREQGLSSKCTASQDTKNGFSPSVVEAAGGAHIPQAQEPFYQKQTGESCRSVGSRGGENGFGSSDGVAGEPQDPEDGSANEYTDLPEVPDLASHKLRDLACESEMRPTKDKAIVEIPLDALGSQDGSATRGTELPQVQDPAGHKQGDAALLEQSESYPRGGIAEKCQNSQDRSAMGHTQRKTLRGFLGEGFRSHPVLTLVLILLLVLVVALVVALAVQSAQSHREIPVTPKTPVLPACPKGWVGYNGICYFLSEDMGSWDQAQDRCSELRASLAMPKDREMMEFLSRLSGNVDYWLGLRRRGQRLQWGDGSSFSSSVEVRGNAECVFLGDSEFWSVKCSNQMQYVCSRAQTPL